MAKQSGLHQIRGKVGEHSYYRQTGVASGLIRSINQGMSARVKTSEAYANTRLNNAEFGQACRIAARNLALITPKFRPMFLAFSQSKLAKAVLDYIKSDTTSAWGQRNIKTEGSFDGILAAVNALAKVNFDDHYTASVEIGTIDTQILATLEVADASYLEAIGADKVAVKAISASMLIGDFLAADNSYAPTMGYVMQSKTEEDNEEVGIELLRAPESAATGFVYQSGVCVLVVMPIRTDAANVDHVLQEYCTFKVLPYAPKPRA